MTRTHTHDKQSTARPLDQTRRAAQSAVDRVDRSKLAGTSRHSHRQDARRSRPRKRATKLQRLWDWTIILSSYALVHWGHPYIAVTVGLLLIQVQWGSVQ